MMSYLKNAALALSLTVVACSSSNDSSSGGGDGISGIYPVKSQTKNIALCNVEGTADTNAPAFYRIFSNSEIFPGAAGWSTEACSSIEVCKDDSIDLSNMIFDEKTEAGWKGESVATATGGENCSVNMTTSEAVKQADGTLEIKVYNSSAVFDFVGDDCKPKSQKVEESKSKLVCTEYKRILTEVAQ